MTEGLGPLDQDRAASVADEGGVSAATVEEQPDQAPISTKASRGKRAPRVRQRTDRSAVAEENP
mgnify:CR=1 FL=1